MIKPWLPWIRKSKVLRLIREIVNHKLTIEPNAAVRTMISGIEPIVEISQRTSIAVEVAVFIGSSPARHYAEEGLLKPTEGAVSLRH